MSTVDTGAQLRRALTAIKELRARLEEVEGARAEPIAIIGMGCRFPGAASPQAFWELLRDGVDAVGPTPADRWNADALYDPDADAPGRVATRWGGFLAAVDRFDAGFFGIAPREADQMDPQQRLLLEVAWETLEDGGLVPARLAGSKTGVFVGVHSHSGDYYLMQAADPRGLDLYSGTGTSHSVVSGRLSYLLDLRGPSVAVDTACSSSLVAIHMAVQSLRNRESNLALAGGVNVILEPTFTIVASRMHMMAADGRCKPFDARADGFVRGEGCGLVLLKRLSDAQADGDHILAVIKGSAINQDGRSNGLTAPNSLSQQAVIAEALANAGLQPGQIGLIEAHGTGTPLGDPIEVEALGAVFGAAAAAGQTCALGSAKANIGHLEGAAGVAGLIKAVLTIRHGLVPPLVHFGALNPHIALAGTPFVIPGAARPWPAGETPRYAGVSSFGWSGSNAHMIIGEAPAPRDEPTAAHPGPYLLPISARTPAALRELARAYGELLRGASEPSVVCAGAALRRAHHEERLAVVGTTGEELAAGLAAIVAGAEGPGLALGRADAGRGAPVVFVFPGQGAQWPGMARQLLGREPVFRAALEACATAFAPFVDWSLVEQLANPDPRLDAIDVIQPALFAIQVGLAALWRSWGVVPDAVVGHSMGEVAAAHVAGILSLEDAARIICLRSQLLRRVRGRGAMAVVGLSAPEAEAALAGHSDRLAVAVSNSRHSTVLSGDPAALDQVMERLRARDVFCRLVKVDVASHSPQVDELLPELRALLAELEPRPGAVPMYSTVTGAVVRGEAARTACGPGYWADNLRRPVRFLDSVDALLAAGHAAFVELSPHPLLLAAIDETAQHQGLVAHTIPSLQREKDEALALRSSLGALYTMGVPVNWRALYPAGARHAELPPYPWQRSRHWLAPQAARATASRDEGQRDGLLGRQLPDLALLPGVRVWERQLAEAALPAGLRYGLAGGAVLSGALVASLALEAAARCAPGAEPRVEQLKLCGQLALAAERTHGVQLSVAPHAEGPQLRIASRPGPDSPWVEYAVGRLGGGAASGEALPLERVDLAEVRAACALAGPALPGLAEVWLGDGQALASVRQDEDDQALAGPLALAGALALLGALGARVGLDELVPAAIDELAGPRGAAPAWAYARIVARADDALTGELALLAADGTALVVCRGVGLVAPDDALRAQLAELQLDSWLYELAWRPLDPPPARPAAPGRWLIFADAGGVAAELAALAAADGAATTLVYPNTASSAASAAGVRVDPANPAELSRALAAYLGAGAPGAVVAYLWGLDLQPGALDETGEELLARQRAPLGGALAVAQGLARLPGDGPRLWLATRGAVATGVADEPIDAAGATLWGLGRVFANEHPAGWGGLVDLDGAPAPVAARALYEAVLAGDGEDQLALRGATRLGARLARTSFAAAAPPRLRPDGTYLLTGGLGGVGLALARLMLKAGARSLAILGRRPLDGPLAAAVAELEAGEAVVAYVQADVADSAALAAALAQLEAAMPPLCGVVHAAGILEDGALLSQSWESFARVMESKLAGAWNLHRATAGRELDLFVLCSSVSALFGNPGQANYAAANAFLDTLAHQRRAAGAAGLSLNWGRWGEVGLATEAARSAQLARYGLAPMAPGAAATAFGRLIGHEAGQAVVAAIDWGALAGQLPRAGATPLLAEVADAAAGDSAASAAPEDRAGLLATLAQAPAAARYELLLAHIQSCVAGVLHFADRERVAPGRGFFQLGMDSLTALELKNRLALSMGRSLAATLAFDYPNAAALARHLLEVSGLAAAAAPAGAPPDDELATLAELSRDDLKSLLDAELDAIDL